NTCVVIKPATRRISAALAAGRTKALFLSQNKPPEPSGGFFFNDNTVYVCAELRCPTGAPIPISPPRKPTSVPSLLADARSQLSLRCSTHNAQNSAAGEGRVSQREEGCTLPVTDGFGEARPLHIDPAAKRPIASRAAAITSINVTRVLRCIVCASYSGGNSVQLCQHSLPEVRLWSFSV